jgi:hypothetical protein
MKGLGIAQRLYEESCQLLFCFHDANIAWADKAEEMVGRSILLEEFPGQPATHFYLIS